LAIGSFGSPYATAVGLLGSRTRARTWTMGTKTPHAANYIIRDRNRCAVDTLCGARPNIAPLGGVLPNLRRRRLRLRRNRLGRREGRFRARRRYRRTATGLRSKVCDTT